MTTKTGVKNGKSVEPQNTATNPEVAAMAAHGEQLAAEAVKVLESLKPVPMVTVQDRFDRLEQFQALERKHTAIKTKSQQLKVLRKANDTTGAEICISSNGEEITLNNGSIVEEVLTLLDGKLDRLAKQTEEEVLTFEI